MLYNIVLVSAIHQRESAVGVPMSLPSLDSLRRIAPLEACRARQTVRPSPPAGAHWRPPWPLSHLGPRTLQRASPLAPASPSRAVPAGLLSMSVSLWVPHK